MVSELAHAQAEGREGHSLTFWRRLARGLEHAGRLELLRYDFGYREAALRIAREYGVPDVPSASDFIFEVGDGLVDHQGRHWKVKDRFRKGGRPFYRLEQDRWIWTLSEEGVLLQAR